LLTSIALIYGTEQAHLQKAKVTATQTQAWVHNWSAGAWY